jgi:hypothetical protein
MGVTVSSFSYNDPISIHDTVSVAACARPSVRCRIERRSASAGPVSLAPRKRRSCLHLEGNPHEGQYRR